MAADDLDLTEEILVVPSWRQEIEEGRQDPSVPMAQPALPNVTGCVQDARHLLSCVGLWRPLATSPIGRWQRVWQRCFPRLHVLQSAYGVLVSLSNVFLTLRALLAATEQVVAVLINLTNLVKIVVLIRGAGRLERLVERVEAMQRTQVHERDGRHILLETQSLSRGLAVNLFRIMTISAVASTTISALGGYMEGTIPFRYWYPFDVTSSPMFELALAGYYVLIIIDWEVLILHDILFYALIAEIIGQFRILCFKMENVLNGDEPRQESETLLPIGRRTHEEGVPTRDGQREIFAASRGVLRSNASETTFRPIRRDTRTTTSERTSRTGNKPEVNVVLATNPEVEVGKRLAGCVRHHQELISLVSEMESIFQASLVIHVVCNVMVGLTIMYIVDKDTAMDFKVITMVSLLFICASEYFVFSWTCEYLTTQVGTNCKPTCEYLTTQSGLVSNALYACAWWDASPAFKKSLRIVTLRANVPLVLRAAKILPVTMETFASVMNTAYKMLNVFVTVGSK